MGLKGRYDETSWEITAECMCSSIRRFRIFALRTAATMYAHTETRSLHPFPLLLFCNTILCTTFSPGIHLLPNSLPRTSKWRQNLLKPHIELPDSILFPTQTSQLPRTHSTLPRTPPMKMQWGVLRRSKHLMEMTRMFRKTRMVSFRFPLVSRSKVMFDRANVLFCRNPSKDLSNSLQETVEDLSLKYQILQQR